MSISILGYKMSSCNTGNSSDMRNSLQYPKQLITYRVFFLIMRKQATISKFQYFFLMVLTNKKQKNILHSLRGLNNLLHDCNHMLLIAVSVVDVIIIY